jgi:phage baseplate assembly protein W
MNIDYPLHFSINGRTASANDSDHIRNLIEQLLFTSPGERVNRPDFGSGLLQLVFAPNGDEMAAASQFLIQGALQQWLGDLISVEEVQIENIDSVLNVRVRYLIRRSGQKQEAQFSRGGMI